MKWHEMIISCYLYKQRGKTVPGAAVDCEGQSYHDVFFFCVGRFGTEL